MLKMAVKLIPGPERLKKVYRNISHSIVKLCNVNMDKMQVVCDVDFESYQIRDMFTWIPFTEAPLRRYMNGSSPLDNCDITLEMTIKFKL